MKKTMWSQPPLNVGASGTAGGRPQHMVLWRGGQGWERRVPLNSYGQIMWNQANGWTAGRHINSYPGSGAIQSFEVTISGNTMTQGYWRNNQGYSVSTTIGNISSHVWLDNASWGGPYGIWYLVGSGSMLSQTGIMTENQYIQSYWRSNGGYNRSVPVVNGVIQWGQASAWGGPDAFSTLPGAGTLQAQTGYSLNVTAPDFVQSGYSYVQWLETDSPPKTVAVKSAKFGMPLDGQELILAAGNPGTFAGPEWTVGGKQLALVTSGRVVIRKTYLLAGQPIAQRSITKESGQEISSELHYIYTDHLGSANTLVDQGGTVVDTKRFYPFGEYRTFPTTDLTNRGFTGHQQNDSLGLIYMNARYYVPGVGRFASADTIVPDPENPQSFNRYSYTLNNPLRYVDPSGHFSEGAIQGYIYDHVCHSDMECTNNTMNTWKQDVQWWDMLTRAEAGDVIFASGGLHFTFLGHENILLDGIRYSTFDGNMANESYDSSHVYGGTLQGLFSGENDLVWGGWYDRKDGMVDKVYHRNSQTTIYGDFEDNILREAVANGAAGGVIGAAVCLPATGGGAIVCGAAASVTTGVGTLFIPEKYGLIDGENLVVSAGHAFVYRPNNTPYLDEEGILQYRIVWRDRRIYGPNHYIPLSVRQIAE